MDYDQIPQWIKELIDDYQWIEKIRPAFNQEVVYWRKNFLDRNLSLDRDSIKAKTIEYMFLSIPVSLFILKSPEDHLKDIEKMIEEKESNEKEENDD